HSCCPNIVMEQEEDRTVPAFMAPLSGQEEESTNQRHFCNEKKQFTRVPECIHARPPPRRAKNVCPKRGKKGNCCQPSDGIEHRASHGSSGNEAQDNKD